MKMDVQEECRVLSESSTKDRLYRLHHEYAMVSDCSGR